MGVPMTVGSLFSGIGGFDLGLERAGMDIRWQVERDPWCQKILAKHWPDVPRYGDVTTLTGDELEPVDLICGGFPCQPVSLAGQQKGTDDDRWLWPEFQRLVGVLRPRYVLVENVPGLLTANEGHAFGEIIGDLAELGYDSEWTMLSAADVGAPHLRKRVWIVADADHDGGSWSEKTRREARPRSLRPHRSQSNHPDVADADHDGLEGYGREHELGKTSSEKSSYGGGQRGRATLADADHQRCVGGRQPEQREQQGSRRGKPHRRLSDGRVFDAPVGGQWTTEPDVGQVAHGVPRRVDRLKGLGNAIVPQCAEWIGRQILATAVSGLLLAIVGCASPVQPSPVYPEPDPVLLQCEEILVHLVRQTYLTRCLHPDTGAVTYH